MATPEKTWWTPVWRGLVADPEGKHLRRMKSALGLYLYLLSHANRRSGRLNQKYETIARDMGFPVRTIRAWMRRLYFYDYIRLTKTGRAMLIDILRWHPIGPYAAPLSGTALPGRPAEMEHQPRGARPRSHERRGQNGREPVANESNLTRGIKRKSVVEKIRLANSEPSSADEERLLRAELLVRDLAGGLSDPDHSVKYRTYVQRFPEPLLRRLLSEARATPERAIKRSKAALFEYLLKRYGISTTPSEPHHSRD